jgi:hypothetical protein
MPRLHCAAALSFIVAGIVDVTGAQAASLRVGDTVQIVHDVEGRTLRVCRQIAASVHSFLFALGRVLCSG